MPNYGTAETYFKHDAGGRAHPPGCGDAGSTPVRFDASGRKVGGGVNYFVSVIKGLNGRNYAKLEIPSVTPAGGVLYDLETHFRPWMQEQGIDWDENRFPVQWVKGFPDVDNGYQFIIVLDCDGGDGPEEYHHRAVLRTKYVI